MSHRCTWQAGHRWHWWRWVCTSCKGRTGTLDEHLAADRLYLGQPCATCWPVSAPARTPSENIPFPQASVDPEQDQP